MKAVIFDVDGVLFDSEPLHLKAWQEFAEPFGVKHDPSFYERWVGEPDRDLATYFQAEDGVPLEVDEIIELKRKKLFQITSCSLVPFDGVVYGLKSLREKGFPMALASTSSRRDIAHMIQCGGLTGFFDKIVGAEDITRPKPDPMPYIAAANLLGVGPHECFAVEDSLVGIPSAKAAGCFTLAVATSYPMERLTLADKAFAGTVDAIAYILGSQWPQA